MHVPPSRNCRTHVGFVSLNVVDEPEDQFFDEGAVLRRYESTYAPPQFVSIAASISVNGLGIRGSTMRGHRGVVHSVPSSFLEHSRSGNVCPAFHSPRRWSHVAADGSIPRAWVR
jgi:hypothetical protein